MLASTLEDIFILELGYQWKYRCLDTFSRETSTSRARKYVSHETKALERDPSTWEIRQLWEKQDPHNSSWQNFHPLQPYSTPKKCLKSGDHEFHFHWYNMFRAAENSLVLPLSDRVFSFCEEWKDSRSGALMCFCNSLVYTKSREQYQTGWILAGCYPVLLPTWQKQVWPQDHYNFLWWVKAKKIFSSIESTWWTKNIGLGCTWKAWGCTVFRERTRSRLIWDKDWSMLVKAWIT